jgi:hypothetical protein
MKTRIPGLPPGIFFTPNPLVSDFVLSASNFRPEAGGLGSFFIPEIPKTAIILVIFLFQRTYAKLPILTLGSFFQKTVNL